MCPTTLTSPSQVKTEPELPLHPGLESTPWQEEVYRDDDYLLESATEVRESLHPEPMRIALAVITVAVLGVAFASLLMTSGV